MHAAFKRFIAYLGSIKQNDPKIEAVVQQYFLSFLLVYTKGLSHRLIRSNLDDRSGLSVHNFLEESRQHASRLVPGIDPGRKVLKPFG